MRYYILLIIISVICCLSLTSCGNEDEKFENIEFKTTGVTLSPPNGISYYGEAGYTGGEITFTAVGKNAENGFLSEIKVGEYFIELPMTTGNSNYPILFAKRNGAK